VIGNASDISLKQSEFKIKHLLYLESMMKNGRAEEFREAYNTEWTGE
jgi:hypothetical protein